MRIKDKHNKVSMDGVSVLTSVCLVIGFNLRKRGLSIISHTWKRKMMDRMSMPVFLPLTLFSA